MLRYMSKSKGFVNSLIRFLVRRFGERRDRWNLGEKRLMGIALLGLRWGVNRCVKCHKPTLTGIEITLWFRIHRALSRLQSRDRPAGFANRDRVPERGSAVLQ